MLLYHTKNSPSLQYYDCLHYIDHDYPVVSYCPPRDESQRLQRDFIQDCHKDGQSRRIRNVSASVMSCDEVLELVDRYSILKINSYAILRIRVHLLNFVNTNFMILFKTI